MPLCSKLWQCLNQHHEKKSFTWTIHLNRLVSSLEFWLGRKLNQGQLCVWPLVPRASHLEDLAFFQCSAVAVMKFLIMIKKGPVFSPHTVPPKLWTFPDRKNRMFSGSNIILSERKEALISREENIYRFLPWGSPYRPGPLLPLPLANECCVVLALKHSQLGSITEEQLL